MNKKKALPAHEVGSGNIFADLGLPNAENICSRPRSSCTFIG